MIKNEQKANTLIKRKNLILFLKEREIKRISPNALIEIEKEICSFLEKKAEQAKQNAFINGRKTIIPEDVSLSKEKSENYLEI